MGKTVASSTMSLDGFIAGPMSLVLGQNSVLGPDWVAKAREK